jgi:hypothetical protein
MIAIVSKRQIDKILKVSNSFKEKAIVIGEVI